MILEGISDDIPTQTENLNMVIPILIARLQFRLSNDMWRN